MLRRYNRFLADAITPDGSVITLHCANTGAMTGCATPGDIIWYSRSDNQKRKYPYSWQLTQTQHNDMICVNTHMANHLAKEAIEKGYIKELTGYQQIQSEVRYGQENSKIDLLLTGNNRPNCFVEIKSVTLLENGKGYFPDTVTERGHKHLRELQYIKQQGYRAVLFFVVLHSGINCVSAARHIDKIYALLLNKALETGLEVICYKATISTSNIVIYNSLLFNSQ